MRRFVRVQAAHGYVDTRQLSRRFVQLFSFIGHDHCGESVTVSSGLRSDWARVVFVTQQSFFFL